MSIGLYRGTVKLEPHDEAWDICAKETISKLKELLKEDLIDAHHIGSTAIRNIAAKPIIDIVLGVNDFDSLLKHNEVLEENGFIYRGQDHPDQHLYICGKDDFITHHIHATIYGSDTWNNYLNIKDYLNAHQEDALAYEDLKKELCEKFSDDRKTYTAHKAAFIEDIINKAKAWRN